MPEHTLQYQFAFFSTDSHWEANVDNISFLLGALGPLGWIPTAAQELEIGQPERPFRMRQQLKFASTDGEWNLAFEPHRILLKREEVDDDAEIGSVEEFGITVSKVFQSLISFRQCKGRRLGFVLKRILEDMMPERLAEVHERTIQPLPFYCDNAPTQWNCREVARLASSIGGLDEKLNVVTDISRVQGEIQTIEQSTPFDRIEIGLDVNTVPENRTARFGIDEIESFLKKVQDIRSRIFAEIEERLREQVATDS